MSDSKTAELLDEICDLDLDALDVQLPRGFGLDLTGPALVRSHHRSDRPRRRPNPPSTPRRTPPFGRRALRATPPSKEPERRTRRAPDSPL